MIACRLADDRLSSARRQVIVSGVIGYHQRDNRRVLPIRSAVVYPKKFGPMLPTVQGGGTRSCASMSPAVAQERAPPRRWCG